ncbi:hypothetical protein [Pseudanabaena sp. UWO311]
MALEQKIKHRKQLAAGLMQIVLRETFAILVAFSGKILNCCGC